MTLELSTLRHLSDFDLQTKNMGTLRCSSPSATELNDLIFSANSESADGIKLAKGLIGKFATKNPIDPTSDKEHLTPSELESILRNELDEYCYLFASRWLNNHRRSAQSLSNSIGCDEFIDEIFAENRFIENQRKEMLEKIQELNSASSIVEKMHSKDLGMAALGAFNEANRASNLLGESLKYLQQQDKKIDDRFSTLNYKPLNTPENPILETNRLLEQEQAYSKEMRSSIIQSMALLKTLTDATLTVQASANNATMQAERNAKQAEQHARKSIWVAISSIVLSILMPFITIYFSDPAPTASQVDKLAKNITQLIEKESKDNEKALITVISKLNNVASQTEKIK